MHPSKHRRSSHPVWWSVQHTVIWEEHLPRLKTEFERRAAAQSRAQLAGLGPDDVVTQKQAATPRNVDVDRAYQVPDNNWEVGTSWEQIEPALRYGVGARAQYPQYESWTFELEALLRKDWEQNEEPSAWEKVKRAVRHGFESVRKKAN